MRSIFADRAAIVLAGALFLGLEMLTITTQFTWPLFAIFLAFLLTGTLIALREELRSRGVHVAILPLAYIVSVFLFHLFVSRGLFQQLFIVGSTIGFLFLIARATEWAYPTWTWLFTSVTFFLWTAGLYGLTFHLRFPLWATALGIGLMTGFLTYHVVGRVEQTVRLRLFWSAVLALLILELLVVLAFLPVTYTVVGGVLFVVFYLLLHLLQHYLYRQLTQQMITEYVSLAALAIFIILLTAEWRV
ncbi:MAG: Uncharacterized protein G01um1014106_330 [Parcubacteria group bacterium Gr01-1014_106]|nr:MAG: Uncharacterized protein G01um1014106_330 [Parcubacteria group bacterium Gr01-1014_106]